MVVLGLVLMVVAALLLFLGWYTNLGPELLLAEPFNLLGLPVTNSAGGAFLVGAIVGSVAMLGLNMLLAGLGRGFKHKVAARREHKQVVGLKSERDELAARLEAERASGGRTVLPPISGSETPQSTRAPHSG